MPRLSAVGISRLQAGEDVNAVVLDKCGVEFNDRDSVLADYNDGRNYADVADEIADEYADCD